MALLVPDLEIQILELGTKSSLFLLEKRLFVVTIFCPYHSSIVLRLVKSRFFFSRLTKGVLRHVLTPIKER